MKDKKFSTFETILALMITIPLDLLELVSGGLISLLLAFVINPLVWFLFFMWFWLKGGHYGRMVIRLVIWFLTNIVELFPILSTLPLRTIAAIVAIRMINSPKEDEGTKEEGGGNLEGESEEEPDEEEGSDLAA